MRLTSAAFSDNDIIPMKHTCDDLDISPPLHWEGVPEEAQSLALTVIDPDAPLSWIYWLVYNIPADAHLIPEGGPVPTGAIEVRNDFGKETYRGPCPPSGEHRCCFTLYALDSKDLLMRKESFLEVCKKHAIDKAELQGRYSRGGPMGTI